MAWTDGNGQNLLTFGVCGNFRFEIYSLTDVKATRSLVKPMMDRVRMVASTNETDNTDVLNAKSLNWTGTQDSAVASQINDAGEVYDKVLTGEIVYNVETGDGSLGDGCVVGYSDANTMLTDDPAFFGQRFRSDNTTNDSGETMPTEAQTLCNATEDYSIVSERVIQVVAADANDDGSMLVIGG